ncbi:MAG: hypothetical protein RSB34_08010, partial [Muribaculaceae bacterium]
YGVKFQNLRSEVERLRRSGSYRLAGFTEREGYLNNANICVIFGQNHIDVLALCGRLGREKSFLA